MSKPSGSLAAYPGFSSTSTPVTTDLTNIYPTTSAADDGRWTSAPALFNNGSTGRIGLNVDVNHTWSRYVLDIPAGATINSASLCMVNQVSRASKSFIIKIQAVKELDPANPTTAADANGRTLTTASVDWVTGTVTYAIGQELTTPDLAAVVQEIIDQPGWSSGNHILFFLLDNGSNSDIQPALLEHATADPIGLNVNYTTG